MRATIIALSRLAPNIFRLDKYTEDLRSHVVELRNCAVKLDYFLPLLPESKPCVVGCGLGRNVGPDFTSRIYYPRLPGSAFVLKNLKLAGLGWAS